MTDTYVYGYDRPSTDGQEACLSCGGINEPGFAYCLGCRDGMRKQTQAILAPRNPGEVIQSSGVCRSAKRSRYGPAGRVSRSNTTSDRRYKRYSLSVDQFERIRSKQGNKCGICGVDGNVKKLHIDHDHKCCPQDTSSCGACVRGLLCSGCNTKLYAIENLDYKMRAEAYLREPPAVSALTKT